MMRYTLLLCLAGAALLTGCATEPATKPANGALSTSAAPAPGGTPSRARPGTPASAPAAAPAPALAPDQQALKEGVDFYNNGDYNNAIKRLASADITASGSKPTQLSALKYTAFSYCLTQRQTLCRQTFEKAFKLDPAFDLAPGEAGHPLWGPMFARAKKGKG
jgi:hypothetical protein